MTRYTPFPDRLRKWRESVGLSQPQAAELFEVDRQSVMRWENGKTFPPPETLRRVAEATGLPIHWFFLDGEPAEALDRQEAQEALRELQEVRTRVERAEERLRRALAPPQPDRVAEPSPDDLAARRAARVAHAYEHLREASAASQLELGTDEAEEQSLRILADTFGDEDPEE